MEDRQEDRKPENLSALLGAESTSSNRNVTPIAKESANPEVSDQKAFDLSEPENDAPELSGKKRLSKIPKGVLYFVLPSMVIVILLVTSIIYFKTDSWHFISSVREVSKSNKDSMLFQNEGATESASHTSTSTVGFVTVKQLHDVAPISSNAINNKDVITRDVASNQNLDSSKLNVPNPDYMKKLNELSNSINSLKIDRGEVLSGLKNAISQINDLAREVAILQGKIESIPNSNDIIGIHTELSNTGQKIDFIKESLSKMDDNLSKTNERSIQNATSIKIQTQNSSQLVQKVETLNTKLSGLDDKLSRKTVIQDVPSRVTYSDGTSITSLNNTNSQSQYYSNARNSDQDLNKSNQKPGYAEPKLVKNIVLKGVNSYEDGNFDVTLENANGQKGKFFKGDSLGKRLGNITDYISGTLNSEPYVRTSNNYIITSSQGLREDLNNG